MKKTQNGFIVPLLLAVIALLLAGGVAYLYTQKKSENLPEAVNVTLSQSTSTAQTAISLKTDETVGWSKYNFTATRYLPKSFSFKYPNDWKVENGYYTDSTGKKEAISVVLTSSNGINQISYSSGSPAGKITCASLKSSEEIPGKLSCIEKEGIPYFVVYQDEETLKVYNQILSTFKFTKTTSTAQTSTEEKQTPFISSLSPVSGPGGLIVTIKGSGLTQSMDIYFNGEVVQNREKYNESPSFRVPSSISNCPPGAYCVVGPQPIPAGAYSVQVANEGSKSNTVTFTVTSEKTVSIPVTATLTVGANGSNPSHSITIKSGDSIKYNWSRSGGTFGTSYTAKECTNTSMDTVDTSTSAAPWGFFAGTANGSTDDFIVDNKWAGCTVLVTYSVFGEDGAKSDTVTVRVSQ